MAMSPHVDQVVPLAASADEEIVASLPRLGPPPTTFEEVAGLKMFDMMMGNTAAERKGGALHSHHVLHLPGKQRSQGSLQHPFLREPVTLRHAGTLVRLPNLMMPFSKNTTNP